MDGNCQGISLGYLLLNLISATEQFTIGFYILVNFTGGTDIFVETPLTTGDWLNLAQLTLVWVHHNPSVGAGQQLPAQR